MDFRNYIVKSGRVQPADPRLVFLAVDQESISIEQIDLDELYTDIPRGSPDYRAMSWMAGGWPFNREVYAIALDKLFEAGVSAVMVDFIFPKPAAGDHALQASLERYRGKVTIVSNIVPPTADHGLTLTVPTSGVLPTEEPESVLGFSNFIKDPWDGTIRAANYRIDFRAESGSGAGREAGDILASLAARTAEKIGQPNLIPEGVNRVPFRFAGPAGTFAPIPLYQIFVPRYWEKNFAGGEKLKGKIVIIGPYGNWSQDFQSTPWGAMPGPELHLNALNALLGSGFLREAPDWLATAGIGAAALLVFLLGSLTRLTPVIRFILVVGAGGLALLASEFAYNHFNLYLPTIFPLMCLTGASLGTLFYEFTAERVERARTRREFEQYMSANVVRAVLDDPSYASNVARGFRRPVTILFSDIRGFTNLTESLPPEELVTLLNEYLGEMVKCVFRHNGTLDKFVGDAVMAVWGNTPVTKGVVGDAADAVRAALDMLRSLETLNAKWRAKGRRELRIGIGLNHGEVTVGNLGSSQKKELTVIGDAVNLASRLEGLTKLYQLPIILGEAVANLVQDEFVLQTVDFTQVVGKTRAVEIFTVVAEAKGAERDEIMDDGLTAYLEGVRRYRDRNAVSAITMLSHAAALRPNDPLIRIYLERAGKRLSEGENAHWEDVVVMTKK
jgi:adenylate cyclase